MRTTGRRGTGASSGPGPCTRRRWRSRSRSSGCVDDLIALVFFWGSSWGCLNLTRFGGRAHSHTVRARSPTRLVKEKSAAASSLKKAKPPPARRACPHRLFISSSSTPHLDDKTKQTQQQQLEQQGPCAACGKKYREKVVDAMIGLLAAMELRPDVSPDARNALARAAVALETVSKEGLRAMQLPSRFGLSEHWMEWNDTRQDDPSAVRAVTTAHEQGLKPAEAVGVVVAAVVGGVGAGQQKQEQEQQKKEKSATCSCM